MLLVEVPLIPIIGSLLGGTFCAEVDSTIHLCGLATTRRSETSSKQTSSPTIEGASALGCLTPLALSASALPINANDLWLAHKSRTKRPPNPLSTCPQKPRLFR